MIIHKNILFNSCCVGKALNREERFLGIEGYCIGGDLKRRVVGPFFS